MAIPGSGIERLKEKRRTMPHVEHHDEKSYQCLESIALRMGRSRWTIKRWWRQHGFPMALLPNGHWFTTEGLIEKWILARSEALHDLEAQAQEKALAEMLEDEVMKNV